VSAFGVGKIDLAFSKTSRHMPNPGVFAEWLRRIPLAVHKFAAFIAIARLKNSNKGIQITTCDRFSYGQETAI
jgi:hypothetical protein